MPWRDLLYGRQGTFWFTGFSSALTTEQFPAIAPDFTLFQVFKWTMEEIAEIKEIARSLKLSNQTSIEARLKIPASNARHDLWTEGRRRGQKWQVENIARNRIAGATTIT